MMVSPTAALSIATIVTITPFVAYSFTQKAKIQITIRQPASSALGVSYLESLSSAEPTPNGIVSTQASSSSNYLESLEHAASSSPSQTASTTTISQLSVTSSPTTGFCHAPLDYFHFNNLSSKGQRATFDWGRPQDWSRKLADDGVFRVGSWYCTEGGWQSPNGKAVTEVFYMLEGHGCLGDADGVKHYFGPGDTVIIPKGHTGRWDVNTPIHKVWAVNAHPMVEESGPIIRVQVDHYKDSSPQHLTDTSANDPLYGNTGSVSSASNTYYNVGPTKVGVWTCESGSFEVVCGERQWFYVLEGTLFITHISDDGTTSSKRCVPGDTVTLNSGWKGYVDVIEPTKKVFTVAL